MTITRKPVTRLFPLEGKCEVSVVQEYSDTSPNFPYTNLYGVSNGYGLIFSQHPGKGDAPYVLPSGYYFSQGIFYKSNEPGVEHSCVYLNNICRWSATATRLDEDLNTSFAAIVKFNPGNHKILGVSKDNQEVFLYALQSSGYFLRSRSSDNQNQQLEVVGYNSGKSGYSVFKTDKKIISIAGFYCFKKPTAAIALDSGEILVGTIEREKGFIAKDIFKIPLFSHNRKLFAAKEGLLVIHNPDTHQVITLHLTEKQEDPKPIYQIHYCPAITNVNLSVDGKYLTARESSESEQARKYPLSILNDKSSFFFLLPMDLRLEVLKLYLLSVNVANNRTEPDESNIIYIIELNPFKINSRKLNKPIADFIVGGNNSVYFANNRDSSNTLKANDNLGFFAGNDNTPAPQPVREKVGTIDELLKGEGETLECLREQEKEKPKPKKNLLFQALDSVFGKGDSDKKDGSGTGPKITGPK